MEWRGRSKHPGLQYEHTHTHSQTHRTNERLWACGMCTFCSCHCGACHTHCCAPHGTPRGPSETHKQITVMNYFIPRCRALIHSAPPPFSIFLYAPRPPRLRAKCTSNWERKSLWNFFHSSLETLKLRGRNPGSCVCVCGGGRMYVSFSLVLFLILFPSGDNVN